MGLSDYHLSDMLTSALEVTVISVCHLGAGALPMYLIATEIIRESKKTHFLHLINYAFPLSLCYPNLANVPPSKQNPPLC